MGHSNKFLEVFGIESTTSEIRKFAEKLGIPIERIQFYNKTNTLPSGTDLERILQISKKSLPELMLRMGVVDRKLLKAISEHAPEIAMMLGNEHFPSKQPVNELTPVFKTNLGELYKGDCISVMKKLDSESVDMIFTDPPFNLNKLYPSKIDDKLKEESYLSWCEEWLEECVRMLKYGGSLFLWNLPAWNLKAAEFLNSRLKFKHWIAVDIKYSLPISGRLYPSHYSLLYYHKGDKPKTFHPDRLAMSVCGKCFGELKDYGGYKDKMNPKGINLSDVWLDIPPVRHAKYKRRQDANELSLKLLDRIIEMSTDANDVIFDPFGGSGTTYIVAELKGRKWIGTEIGPEDDIVNRFNMLDDEGHLLNKYRSNYNSLFPDKVRKERLKLNLWTCETLPQKPL